MKPKNNYNIKKDREDSSEYMSYPNFHIYDFPEIQDNDTFVSENFGNRRMACKYNTGGRIHSQCIEDRFDGDSSP